MPKVIAFDSETALFEPGLAAPELVCVSVADDVKADLYTARAGWTVIRGLLNEPETILVGHNIAFDFAVLAAFDQEILGPIFAAYKAGRIRDTGVRQQLLDIAAGTFRGYANQSETRERPEGYSLSDLSARWLGHALEGKHRSETTPWRLRYSELIGKKLPDWPEEAKTYAKTDARTTYDVLKAQNASCEAPVHEEIVDEPAQVYSAFALNLMGVWGVRTRPDEVAKLEALLKKQTERVLHVLTERGVYRWKGTKKEPRRDGISKDTKRVQAQVKACFAAAGQGAPLTDGALEKLSGDEAATVDVESLNVKIDEETLLEAARLGMATPDLALRKQAKELRALARVAGDQKLLNTYVPVLWEGTKVPINAKFRVLVSSGRTACAKPNLQNLPKKPGVRECYAPRPGFLYVSCDYDIFELRTLAQVLLWMFGKSAMAEALQADRELHLDFAAKLLGLSYEEAVKRGKKDPEILNSRNMAKVANFGLPGGLGAERLSEFARSSYGMSLEVEQAVTLKAEWMAAYPEMKLYFREISKVVGNDVGGIRQFVSDRYRGGCHYTDACNTLFQGLAADAAKAAVCQAAFEAYVDTKSPFFGSRPVVFIHDEIIAEVPEDRAHEAATRLGELMCEAAKPFIPDIPVKASPALMRFWAKGADTVRDDSGRLIPWAA